MATNELIGRCIDLSALAYADAGVVEAGIPGFKNFRFIEHEETDTQALVCNDDNYRYLAVRGTEVDSLDDIRTNLDLGKTDTMWGRVHSGFYLDALGIRPAASRALASLPYLPLSVAGHSQGAAVGLAFSRMLPFFPAEFVGIGTPRVFGTETAQKIGSWYGHRINLVVNNNDPITRVPPRSWGFEHPFDADIWYLSEDGNLEKDWGAWARFLDRVKGRIRDIGEWGTDGLKDHPIKEYQRIWGAL